MHNKNNNKIVIDNFFIFWYNDPMIKLLMLLFSFQIYAAEKTMLQIGSSVSLHPMASVNSPTVNFSNKLSDDGKFVLNKPTIILSNLKSKYKKYSKYTLFYSRDCVDSPVYGFVYSSGVFEERFHLGFAIGGYFMNDKEWNKREIPPSWISIHNKYTGPHTAIVPMIGGDLNIKVLQIGKVEVNWNTYINPFLINSTISIGFGF